MQGADTGLTNCVPMIITRFSLCVPIVVPTHMEIVVLIGNE